MVVECFARCLRSRSYVTVSRVVGKFVIYRNFFPRRETMLHRGAGNWFWKKGPKLPPAGKNVLRIPIVWSFVGNRKLISFATLPVVVSFHLAQESHRYRYEALLDFHPPLFINFHFVRNPPDDREETKSIRGTSTTRNPG